MLEKLPCSSAFLINYGFRDQKLFGAFPFGESCQSSPPTPGRGPGWQHSSQCPALPHGTGLSPSASLAQITEKPGLSIK